MVGYSGPRRSPGHSREGGDLSVEMLSSSGPTLHGTGDENWATGRQRTAAAMGRASVSRRQPCAPGSAREARVQGGRPPRSPVSPAAGGPGAESVSPSPVPTPGRFLPLGSLPWPHADVPTSPSILVAERCLLCVSKLASEG